MAGPTSINPVGRCGGARVSNVRTDAGGVQSTPERCGAAARCDSDDEAEGEEGEEDEDAQASYFYTVPDTASARIKEVLEKHTCMHVGHTHDGPTRAVNRRFISMPCIAPGPFSPLSPKNGLVNTTLGVCFLTSSCPRGICAEKKQARARMLNLYTQPSWSCPRGQGFTRSVSFVPRVKPERTFGMYVRSYG